MIAAGAGILIYTLLVGADPAVVRAAIMGGLSLLALRLGRRTHGLASLGAAGVAMTVADPPTLFDVGFQLSFAATLGMILYAQPLQDAFQAWLTSRWTVAPERAGAVAGPIGEYFLFTLAAQVTTLPLTVFYFHRLSLGSILANPAILPAQPAVMILGGLATLIGSLWLAGGQVLALAAWPFAAYTIRAVSWFAELPLANLGLGWIDPIWVVGFYAVLFGITISGRLPTLPKLRLPSVPRLASLTALAVGVFLTWDNVARLPDGRLRLSVLDTRGGQAVLVISPNGRAALIGGGSSPIALENQLGRRLAPFNRTIDWLILATSQEQDLLGLADLTDRFTVQGVLADDSAGDGPAWALVRSLHEDGVPFAPLQTGTVLELGDGARLSVVGADGGDGAIEIAMDWARFVVLSEDGMNALASLPQSSSGQAQVIVLRQAADVTPEMAQWLIGLTPSAIVISCDPVDPKSLPSPALEAAFGPDRLLRTDQLGAIEFATDGRSLWATSQRQTRALPGS